MSRVTLRLLVSSFVLMAAACSASARDLDARYEVTVVSEAAEPLTVADGKTARLERKTVLHSVFGPLETGYVLTLNADAPADAGGQVLTTVSYSAVSLLPGRKVCVGTKEAQCIELPSASTMASKGTTAMRTGDTATFGHPGSEVRVKLIEATPR